MHNLKRCTHFEGVGGTGVGDGGGGGAGGATGGVGRAGVNPSRVGYEASVAQLAADAVVVAAGGGRGADQGCHVYGWDRGKTPPKLACI